MNRWIKLNDEPRKAILMHTYQIVVEEVQNLLFKYTFTTRVRNYNNSKSAEHSKSSILHKS